MTENTVPKYKVPSQMSQKELSVKLSGYLDRFKKGERSKQLERRIKTISEELSKR